MANIIVEVFPENDLTIFTVEGDLSADEIVTYSSKHYVENPTKLVLWDAAKGSVSKITADDFRNIAKKMKNQTKKREGGKTAIVGKFDVDFGSARMYGAYAELEEIKISYNVFRNADDAMKWLQE